MSQKSLKKKPGRPDARKAMTERKNKPMNKTTADTMRKTKRMVRKNKAVMTISNIEKKCAGIAKSLNEPVKL